MLVIKLESRARCLAREAKENREWKMKNMIACENSRPSSLPARVALRVKTSFTRNATRAESDEGRLFSQAKNMKAELETGTT